ncbi:MAG TPA: hypothetical protein VMY35_19180 [Phycisphaerae bacterium]|nr:hypothetical protein [Phycisphaerae bacterium]
MGTVKPDTEVARRGAKADDLEARVEAAFSRARIATIRGQWTEARAALKDADRALGKLEALGSESGSPAATKGGGP